MGNITKLFAQDMSYFMVQECYSNVTGVLQGCYRDVSKMLQECYRDVTGCYWDVTGMLQ